MAPNHPVSQDITSNALNRKQSPTIMQQILSIVGSSGIDNSVSHLKNLYYFTRLYNIEQWN